MARVAIIRPERIDDPVIREIFAWVTDVEGAMPNHFYVEMNFPGEAPGDDMRGLR